MTIFAILLLIAVLFAGGLTWLAVDFARYNDEVSEKYYDDTK